MRMGDLSLDFDAPRCDDLCMTNHDDAISTLAIMLLNASDLTDPRLADADHITLLHALTPILTPSDRHDLALACDLCPIHTCDIEICADDDDAECRSLRASL